MQLNKLSILIKDECNLRNKAIASLTTDMRQIEKSSLQYVTEGCAKVLAALAGAAILLKEVATAAWELVADKFPKLPEGAATVTAFLKAVAELFGFETMKAGILLLIGTAAIGIIGGALLTSLCIWLKDEVNRKEFEASIKDLVRVASGLKSVATEIDRAGIITEETLVVLKDSDTALSESWSEVKDKAAAKRWINFDQMDSALSNDALTALIEEAEKADLPALTPQGMSSATADYWIWQDKPGMLVWLMANFTRVDLALEDKLEALEIIQG